MEPFYPIVNQNSELAWQHTEQSQATTQNPFRRKRVTLRRPKPQRGYIRMSHQAPPRLFLFLFSNRKHINKFWNYLIFSFIENAYSIKVKHFIIFSLASLKA